MDICRLPIFARVWILKAHDMPQNRGDSQSVFFAIQQIIDFIQGVELAFTLKLKKIQIIEVLTFFTALPAPRNSWIAFATEGFSATIKAIFFIRFNSK